MEQLARPLMMVLISAVYWSGAITAEEDYRARFADRTYLQQTGMRVLVEEARHSYEQTVNSSEQSVPDSVARRADCVVIITPLSRSVFASQSGALAVVSCKFGAGRWGAPTLTRVKQNLAEHGAPTRTTILFLRGPDVRSAVRFGELKFGVDLPVLPGPLGRSAAGWAVTDWNGAYLYTYSEGRFEMADGGALLSVKVDDRATAALYEGREDRDTLSLNLGQREDVSPAGLEQPVPLF